jgi:hypothetical protein
MKAAGGPVDYGSRNAGENVAAHAPPVRGTNCAAAAKGSREQRAAAWLSNCDDTGVRICMRRTGRLPLADREVLTSGTARRGSAARPALQNGVQLSRSNPDPQFPGPFRPRRWRVHGARSRDRGGPDQGVLDPATASSGTRDGIGSLLPAKSAGPECLPPAWGVSGGRQRTKGTHMFIGGGLIVLIIVIILVVLLLRR